MNPYAHSMKEIRASYDTDYLVIKKCSPNCPACAYMQALREIGKWLDEESIAYSDVNEGGFSVNIGFDSEDWRKLIEALLRGEMPEVKE